MTQTLTKLITFAEFIEWKPERGSYELYDGVIVEMSQPLGQHEAIKGFLATELAFESRRLNLPYLIPNQALVKPPESESGYLPDILLINRTTLANEPLWEKFSTISQASSIPLVVEVVSTAVASSRGTRPTPCLTNWRDDYYRKLGEYEEIGIPEYWIVDYLPNGAKKFVTDYKQPTISIYYLVDDEYEISQFRGNDQIVSPTFPELTLTANQIFQASNAPS
jgi:Uma2 family endonuclease